MKENINIKGNVKIKLIDKETNKIIEEKEIKNVLCLTGALNLAHSLTGAQTTTPISRVCLFDSSKNFVKGLVTSYTYSGQASSIVITFSANDSSNETYTFRYLTLYKSYTGTPPYTDGYFANDQGTNVTKQSNQALIIEWTVNIGFSSYP